MRIASTVAVAALALIAGIFVARNWDSFRSLPPTAKAQPKSTAQVAPVSVAALVDLDGEPVTLDRWRGKLRLVNFWATWCAPCRQEIPIIQQVRQRHLEQQFEVIGIAFDRAEAVRRFRDEFSLQYPLLLSTPAADDLLARFGNNAGALPHSALLGPAGKVLETHTGVVTEDQLERWLRPHLGS